MLLNEEQEMDALPAAVKIICPLFWIPVVQTKFKASADVSFISPVLVRTWSVWSNTRVSEPDSVVMIQEPSLLKTSEFSKTTAPAPFTLNSPDS